MNAIRTEKAPKGLRVIGGLVVAAAASALIAACGTGAGASNPTPSPSHSTSFSACMRAHGVPDFPDPDANGQYQLRGGQGSHLNQNDPTFQAASRACGAGLSQNGGGGNTAQQRAQALQFSQCMRAHGISDFPDPNADGGLTIDKNSGDLNPNNAQFQAAQQACQHYMNPPSGGGPVPSGS